MGYVRGRRLTEAAGRLENGAPNLLHVALEAGYGSHEAFSRAFKAQFGMTPEEARKSRPVAGWTAPLARLESKMIPLKEPEIRREGAWNLVGMRERHLLALSAAEGPAHWRRFMAGPYAEIACKRPGPPVGAAYTLDDESYDYLCAAPVTQFAQPPRGCENLVIPPAEYAVFLHESNVSRINETYRAIYDVWLPASGRQLAEAPSLDTYTDAFDPRTGEGGVRLWIPLKPGV